MNTCPFAETAKKVAARAGLISDSTLRSASRWHLCLSAIGSAIVTERGGYREMPERQRRDAIAVALRTIAFGAASILFDHDVEPTSAFVAEWERAAVKHPGMTLDADGPTDENRFYALAEEVGEVCAALTYDNAQGTGHNVDLISEVTQVGALALAWLARYQNEEEQ